MIGSHKELHFYIKADRMMNRGRFTDSIKFNLIYCCPIKIGID